LKIEYDQKSEALASDYTSYNFRVNAFNAESESARKQGGVTEEVHNRMLMENEALTSLQENLRIRQEDLKNEAETINNLVIVINQIASNRNLDIVSYRNTGKKPGDEFCEGNFIRNMGRQSINIYQFGDNNQLIRVITHELGHALGLEHTNTAQSVMYKAMQTNSLELTSEDISELKERCGK
jgi:hypothetical protein